MDRVLRTLLLAAVLGALAWAVLRWPHVDTVETGHSPEYPELRPRDYAAAEPETSRAVTGSIPFLIIAWSWLSTAAVR